jgi:flagellar protein FlaI
MSVLGRRRADLYEEERSPRLGVDETLALAVRVGDRIAGDAAQHTVNVAPELDEDAFFTGADGEPTVVTRYDLEKAVPAEKKGYLIEVERYWVNKPYAFVVIFHSLRENEKKYYLIEPHLSPIERKLKQFLGEKLRTAIKHSDDEVLVGSTDAERAVIIEREAHRLFARYALYRAEGGGLVSRVRDALGLATAERAPGLVGSSTRPEPALLEEDTDRLTPYQVAKLLYYLERDFVGFERIDGIKHDINVEDISCDGYDSPVFVYHSVYEQLITNLRHGKQDLDAFVIKLAQRSGKGISKRQPQVDATLPDGSRAQLTLGTEVSGHGTNYTIRQFRDVPFTPIDLINWKTFALEELAFLWMAIENKRSIVFAGGTASGKTTSLNACSLFIPSKAKIVSIEDTREVELPQRNWIASVTRASFTEDDKGEVDEFDLLEAALRQRPEFIVMGEVRGEEGRTLFQVMSTGHTTLTTFHAGSVSEVIKRFTTAPINVSKTMFTALDLVSIQTSTRVHGKKVRRNKGITEINHYDSENDEINVNDVFVWAPETDQFAEAGASRTLEDLRFDRGWTRQELDDQVFKRKVVLAYLIDRGLNEYTQVAATLQAFINDPDTILALIAQDELGQSLVDLQTMESVTIDIDPAKEAMVPRPDPDEETRDLARTILDTAERHLFPVYRERVPNTLLSALSSTGEGFLSRSGADQWREGSLTFEALQAAREPAPVVPRTGLDADVPVMDADGGEDRPETEDEAFEPPSLDIDLDAVFEEEEGG